MAGLDREYTSGNNTVRCPICHESAPTTSTQRAAELLEGHMNNFHPGRELPNRVKRSKDSS